MPVFEFSAVTAEGKPVKGFEQGLSLEDAARQLASRGLTIQHLAASASFQDPLAQSTVQQEVSRAASAPPPPVESPQAARTQGNEGPPTTPRSVIATDVIGPLVGGVPLKDLHFFFRQFSTMIEAGVGMAQSLETLGKNARHPKFRGVIMEAAEHSVAGRPLSVAFQRYPEVFSPLIMSMIRAGEQGGFLSEQCRQLADYLQRDIELRNLIRRETAYPKLVIGASIIIVLGANLVIGALAPGAGGLWSPLTQPVVWLFLGPALILGWIAFRYLRQSQFVMGIVSFLTQLVPWFGGMVKGFAMAKFGRAFGALYRAGVDLPKALMLAADACGNENLRGRMYPAAGLLEQGVGVTAAFEHTGAFSPIVMDMIRTGETTGNIDLMMVKMAEYYEDEGTVRARQMAMLIGVVCFLIVAAYVMFVVISFYTGYFNNITRGV